MFNQAFAQVALLALFLFQGVLAEPQAVRLGEPKFHVARMHHQRRRAFQDQHHHQGRSIQNKQALHASLSKRVTQEQAAQKASLDCWNDAFSAMNNKWQQAVMDGWDISFDKFSTSHGGLPEPLNCHSGSSSSEASKPSSTVKSAEHGGQEPKSSTHKQDHPSTSHASWSQASESGRARPTSSFHFSASSSSKSSTANASVATGHLNVAAAEHHDPSGAPSKGPSPSSSPWSSSSSTSTSSRTSSAAQSTSTASSGSYTCTYDSSAEDIDSLMAKAPSKLQAIKSSLISAASSLKIQPQLLVAIAMIESTGGSDSSAYSNGGGMFQFTDSSAWSEYSDGASSPLNDSDAVWAAARYLAALCTQEGGNLYQALRDYNGSGEGANWSYQDTVYSFMSGQGF